VPNTEQAEYEKMIAKAFPEYFEGPWLEMPLKSLGGITTKEAIADPAKRNRLDGTLYVLESLLILDHLGSESGTGPRIWRSCLIRLTV